MSPGRLDRHLVDAGVVSSREKAKEVILRGDVSVNQVVTTKPSHLVTADDEVVVTDSQVDVGRGAGKLRAALDHFGLDVSGMTALDVGASTGGFSQVLLERGAATVVALDVGHGQLDPTIASDPRVRALEGVNIVDMSPERWASLSLPMPIDVVVCDVSFVSLTAVIPTLQQLCGPKAHWLLLVKPQFEVGKGKTRQGVVLYEHDRRVALDTVLQACAIQGRAECSWVDSPVVGKKGNREFLLYCPAEDPHQAPSG